jgi:hypothetical protein
MVTRMMWSDLQKDIGSRFVGEPSAFLFFVPLWWVMSMWATPDTDVVAVFWANMAANAVAFGACLGLLIVFRTTIFSERRIRTVPTHTVLAAGIVLGAFKSFVTVGTAAALIGDWD